MCQLKSCLVLKDRVFCPDYNSHQQMLEELGIEDDYLHASKTFVRVEFTPPDNTKSLMEPLDRWTLKVDQDVTPKWWDEKADRQRVEEAVEIWRKGHVFTEGKHSVKAGKVYAYGNAIVTAYDNATVTACSNAKVYAFGKTTVETVSNVPVEAYGDATVKAYGIAKVQASDRTVVKAYSNATVEACDSATVEAYNSVTVKAHDNAKVYAFDRAIVKACNSATVEAFNSAMVIYPEEKKIIYPTGWTAETHE